VREQEYFKMKKVIVQLLIALLFWTSASGCNKTLATSDQGKITEEDLQNVIDLYNIPNVDSDPELKKRIVRDLLLFRALSNQAIAEKLNESEYAKYSESIVESNIIRNVLFEIEKESIENSKESVYHARHILLKGADPANPGLADSGNNKSDEELLAEANKLRKDLQDGTISFEEASDKFSQDPGARQKQGDLGFFTAGVMVEDFQKAVERLAEKSEKELYRVMTEKAALYSEKEMVSKSGAELSRYQLVEAEESGDSWIKVSVNDQTGYIRKSDLQKQEEEKKYSVPVRSPFGWHIVEVMEHKKVTKDGYIDLVADTEFSEDQEPEKRAEAKVNMQWDRLKGNQMNSWQADLIRSYGFDDGQLPALDPKWQNSEVIIRNDHLELKRDDFIQFIKWVASEQKQDPSSIYKDKDALSNYFNLYGMIQIYLSEGEKREIKENKEYKKRADVEKSRFYYELYKKEHWQQDTTVTDQELKAQYDQMKASGHYGDQLPPYSKIKEDLRKHMEQQKVMQWQSVNEDKYLESIHFAYDESLNKAPEMQAAPGQISPPQGGVQPH